MPPLNFCTPANSVATVANFRSPPPLHSCLRPYFHREVSNRPDVVSPVYRHARFAWNCIQPTHPDSISCCVHHTPTYTAYFDTPTAHVWRFSHVIDVARDGGWRVWYLFSSYFLNSPDRMKTYDTRPTRGRETRVDVVDTVIWSLGLGRENELWFARTCLPLQSEGCCRCC